jgi:hypothetical protein
MPLHNRALDERLYTKVAPAVSSARLSCDESRSAGMCCKNGTHESDWLLTHAQTAVLSARSVSTNM